MAPAAYMTEDALVGHQWKEKPLVLPVWTPGVGECGGGERGLEGSQHPYRRRVWG